MNLGFGIGLKSKNNSIKYNDQMRQKSHLINYQNQIPMSEKKDVNTQVMNLLSDSYEETIELLKGHIATYEGEQGGGMTGLCKDMEISRSNLARAMSPNDSRELSVWLFISICQHLGYWPSGVAYTATPEHEKISLRVLLSIPKEAIVVALLRVHAA